MVTWVSHENAHEMRVYLVLEPSVIRIMPIVNLAFVVYNGEQFVLIYCLRAGVPLQSEASVNVSGEMVGVRNALTMMMVPCHCCRSLQASCKEPCSKKLENGLEHRFSEQRFCRLFYVQNAANQFPVLVQHYMIAFSC